MRWRRRTRRQPQISLLVPFRDDGEHRGRVWAWLDRYWSYQLKSVEVVIGYDDGHPFSKSAAVNHAAQRANGRVFVVLDADCYMDPEVVQSCADAIDVAEKAGRRLWFVPYHRLHRLTRDATMKVLRSDPHHEHDVPLPPPASWVEPGSSSHYGHQYGAMILIMPERAFRVVSGMDERFRGWGGEDASFMRALDTMFALHETVDSDVLHLWHVRPGNDHKTRRWAGQRVTSANSRLAQRYGLATGDPTLMKALIDEERQLKRDQLK